MPGMGTMRRWARCCVLAALLGKMPVGVAQVAPDGHRLGDHVWRLTASDDGTGWPIRELLVPGRRPVEITFDQTHIGVRNLCNRSAVGYRFEGEVLVARGIETTMMGCFNALGVQERAFYRLLQDSPTLVWLADVPFPRFQLRGVGAAAPTLTFQGFPTLSTRYGSAGETIVLEVAPQRMRCVAWEPEPRCLKVRRRSEGDITLPGSDAADDGPDWHPFPHPIEGYAHEDGAREIVAVTAFRYVDPTTGLPDTAYFSGGVGAVRRTPSSADAVADDPWPAW